MRPSMRHRALDRAERESKSWREIVKICMLPILKFLLQLHRAFRPVQTITKSVFRSFQERKRAECCNKSTSVCEVLGCKTTKKEIEEKSLCGQKFHCNFIFFGVQKKSSTKRITHSCYLKVFMQ